MLLPGLVLTKNKRQSKTTQGLKILAQRTGGTLAKMTLDNPKQRVKAAVMNAATFELPVAVLRAGHLEQGLHTLGHVKTHPKRKVGFDLAHPAIKDNRFQPEMHVKN